MKHLLLILAASLLFLAPTCSAVQIQPPPDAPKPEEPKPEPTATPTPVAPPPMTTERLTASMCIRANVAVECLVDGNVDDECKKRAFECLKALDPMASDFFVKADACMQQAKVAP